MPLGSGGAILDDDWFLNFRDIKFLRKALEIERNDGMLAHSED
jgi:hypothetical protein